MLNRILFSLAFLFSSSLFCQPIQDGFEGNGNISSWFGDNCNININQANPFIQGINQSSTVLSYHDIGGQYANVRFDAGRNLNLSQHAQFSFKIYVPSSGLTGNQPNQVSLKLQDGSLGSPWTTQTEIIKPIALNQWQTVQFDFATDPYINLDPNSSAPTQRQDLNRILIQVNGENNTDQVLAYIDDFYYYDTLIPPPVYNQLIWSDEFNGSGAIDTSKWFHQTQLPLPGSWYNGEIQHYTDRQVNSFQSNGYLNIVAKKEVFTDQGHTKQYTSARLNSKFTFRYGKVEIRAQLPTGVGTWPALWTLGKNIIEPGAYWTLQGMGTQAWPACGEIDIMEHWGSNQNFVQSALHTPSSHGNTFNKGGQTIPTASSNFHVYTLEWRPDKMIFSVDSVVHYIYNPSVKDSNTWPFDLNQYFLFNIAIQPSISPNFTQSSMLVDYIRVYQQGTVGLQDIPKSQKPGIYPNPSQGPINLQYHGLEDGQVIIDIFQVDGKRLVQCEKKLQNGTLEIPETSFLKPGFYFLKTQIGSTVHTQPFVLH